MFSPQVQCFLAQKGMRQAAVYGLRGSPKGLGKFGKSLAYGGSGGKVEGLVSQAENHSPCKGKGKAPGGNSAFFGAALGAHTGGKKGAHSKAGKMNKNSDVVAQKGVGKKPWKGGGRRRRKRRPIVSDLIALVLDNLDNFNFFRQRSYSYS